VSTAVKTQSPASAAPTGQKVAPQTTGQKTLVGLLAVLAFVGVISEVLPGAVVEQQDISYTTALLVVGLEPPAPAGGAALPPRRTLRLRAISPARDSGKSDVEAPGPKSRFMYVLKSQYPHRTEQNGICT